MESFVQKNPDYLAPTDEEYVIINGGLVIISYLGRTILGGSWNG